MGWEEFKQFVMSLLKKSELCVSSYPAFVELKKCWGCYYVIIKFRENNDSLLIKFKVADNFMTPIFVKIKTDGSGKIKIHDYWDGVRELTNPQLVEKLRPLLRRAVDDWDSEAFDSAVELLLDLVYS